jgi:hypothetical protein
MTNGIFIAHKEISMTIIFIAQKEITMTNGIFVAQNDIHFIPCDYCHRNFMLHCITIS